MEHTAIKLLISFSCLFIGITSSSYSKESKSSIQQRKLIPGRTSETFYHNKLKKTILINGAFTPGPWHTKHVELWQWNNNDWELVSDSGPEVRNSFSYAYDDKRNVLVLFGGTNVIDRNRKYYDDTWEWNGKSWTKIETPVNCGMRYSAKMIYDPVRSACILFGGENEKGDQLNDTWAYKGKEWKKIFTDGPSARFPGAMVYFPVNKKIYLYGGHAPRSTTGRNTGDTWELGEVGWKEIKSSTSPGIRAETEIIFNSKARSLWLIGGVDSKKFLEEIWEFDGNQWKQLDIKGFPSRTFHGLSYSPDGTILAYGGVNVGGGPRLKDTWIIKQGEKEWKCVKGCIDELEQWVNDHTDDGEELLSLITLSFQLNNPGKATTYISRAVQSNSLPRNWYTRMSFYLVSQKKYQEAIPCYEKALAMEPRGADFYNLACAYSLLNPVLILY